MKATKYYTTKGAEYFESPVFPSMPLNNVNEVRRTSEKINEGFLGFGVALTGSSCYHLAQMQKEERRAFLESIYGKGGLGLSVARLTIGASDYSAEIYTYDDAEGDVALKHFSIDRDKKYIIPMIREILEINPDLYLYASPWSPPAWMKTENSIAGGYMRREFIDCYAEYIVRFIQEYEKCGIKISALTPQNETQTDQRGLMPACIWHPDIEAEFVSVLRKKLKQRGLQTEIWIFDHNFDNWKRVKWMLDEHSSLKDDCNGIAFHYYDHAIEDTLPLKKSYPNLSLHFTEGGPRLYDHYDTDWCKWSIMMSKTLNCGYKSFTGWNLMLDQFGGPNVGPFFCGGLITRHNQTGELSYSGQYKAFAHVAKYVRPNSVIYKLEDRPNHLNMATFPSKPSFTLQATCIENEDGTIVYLLVNANEHKEQVQIFEDGQWYYVELLPDTVATVVFEKDEQ